MWVFAAEEPNSYFLPGDVNEFYWGTAAFLIILGLFLWKGLPFIRKAMAARSERIRTELHDAETARSGAEAELSALRSDLSNAEAEAERIRSDARVQADKLKADLIARAEADIEAAKERARVEIEAGRSQALADLRAEVAAQASAAAEALVLENLDQSTQNDLVEKYIAQVGAAR